MTQRLLSFALSLGFGFTALASTHNVSVTSNQFTPANLTISVGDTVVWTNMSGSHNVDGRTTTYPSNPASFYNGLASPAMWTFQHVFTTAGVYDYECTPHAAGGMVGTVTVNALPSPDLIITGVFDADLTGGQPKGVELYVVNSISDLSTFGLGSANNGGGTDGQEYTFPAVAVNAGDIIYATTDSAAFHTWFGFPADFVDNGFGLSVNGDDAIELFSNGSVIDVFGDINTDGTGTAWDYDDSWAYRVSNTGPDGSNWTIGNWTFGGVNAFDTYSNNATSNPPMPIGTYTMASMRPGYPKASIAQATSIDANFVPDSLNSFLELNGIVYTIDFDGNGGYSFYMYDNTGGINVFNFSDVSGYQVAMGDSITAYGEIIQFRGLTELQVDSIVLHSSNNTIKAPAVVTDLNETTEGEWVELQNFTLVNATQWPSSGSSANVDITNGTDTLTIRIDSDTDIDGSPAPTGAFDVSGAGAQFTFANPANDGYQLFPISQASFTAATTMRPGYPKATIAQATSIDANFVPDSLNSTLELNGIVYTIDFDGNNGYSFYMYDNTGGINVFNFNDVSGYQVAMGDSITAYGEIIQFRGLTELEVDSIVLHSSNNTIKAPAAVSTLDETTEGEWVQLQNFTLVNPTQWPSSGSSANVDITNGTDTLAIRIDSDTDIDGSPAPTGAFNVSGAGSQFTFANPANDGYQLFPISQSSFSPVTMPRPGYSQLTIAQATTNDANLVPDSINALVELSGVVYTIDFDGNGGYSFYIYDNTGGINVFNFNDVSGYQSAIGDSIIAYGEIIQFRGLTELEVDSIMVLKSGLTLKTPTAITTLDETTEGEYIEAQGFSVVNPGSWPSSGSSANVDITNGTDTLTMRIDSDTDIDGSPVPSGTFDVSGAGSQFTFANPANDGYQMFPSSLASFSFPTPTTPTLDFDIASITVLEDVGSIDVTLSLNPVSATQDTVTLQVTLGSNVTIPADGSITPAPNATTGIFELVIPAGADSTGFTISVVDDAIMEGNETLFVDMIGTSANIMMGATTNFTFIVEDNDQIIPVYDIVDVTGLDANFEPDSVGVECKLLGTVFTPNFQGGGLSIYMHDGTDGINVFSFNAVPGYTPAIGDSIRAIGTIAFYNGLTEIIVDSIAVISTGNAIQQPTVVTGLGEATESEFIRLNGFYLADASQWPSAGSNSNVDITNGTDTLVMRIDRDTDIDGSLAPTGYFDVLGVGGQFDGSSPYDSGYQLFPRDSTDIIPLALPSVYISEVMANSDLLAPLNGDWFEIVNNGTTTIDLNGFSWSDDSRTAGSHTITSNTSLPAGEAAVVVDVLTANVSSWIAEWKQNGNNLIILNTGNQFAGFSQLDNSGDTVYLFDAVGREVSSASYSSSEVVAGASTEFDNTGTATGISTTGLNGAYTSVNGDEGSPGNMAPTNISLNELLSNNFTLYPNPAADHFVISSGRNAQKVIRISNANGQLVQSLVSTDADVKVNVNSLKAGVYIINIEMEGTNTTRKLVVK